MIKCTEVTVDMYAKIETTKHAASKNPSNAVKLLIIIT